MNKELIENTEKRLRVLITVALFFPIIIQALSNLSKNNAKDVNSTLLQWGGSIALVILTYILFDWNKRNLPERILKLFNLVILFTLICYVVTILFIAFIAKGFLILPGLIYMILYIVSLVGIITFPLISVILLLFYPVFKMYKGIFFDIRDFIVKSKTKK